MKMIRYIAIAAFALAALTGRAQLSLYMDPHIFDTISNRSYQLNNNNAVNIPAVSITLLNQSGTAFSDSIYFGYSVTSGGVTRTHTSDTGFASGVYYPVTYVTIQPQGSAVVGTILFHFTSPVFVVGSSLVVIWPIVKGHNAQVDSAAVSFDITAPDGISADAIRPERVFMSGPDLVIQQEENSIGSIRIYDLAGQLVLTHTIQNEKRIPMAQYTDGIYTVEAVSREGERQVYKVLKSSDH